MTFSPGDRLKSTLSGKVFVYSLFAGTRPVNVPQNFIPVRGELWSDDPIVWWDPDKLELVDDDYYDAARDGVQHAS